MAAQGLRLQRRARLDAAGPAARPGLGVIDSTGEPKPVWYAMRRAFRPVQVVFTDEGTNGLDVHVVNETDAALDVELEVVCLRGGKQQVVSGSRAFKLAAETRSALPAPRCSALSSIRPMPSVSGRRRMMQVWRACARWQTAPFSPRASTSRADGEGAP